MGLFDFFTSTTPPADGPPLDSGIQKGDARSFPVMRLRYLKTHPNGTNVQVYGYIANMCSDELMLDKIRIFNTPRELDTPLRAGEEREFLLYDGSALTREGDYFQAVYDVAFSYNSADKTYMASDVYLKEPIRDIYG